MSNPTIDVQVQLNDDKSIQYILYKWKGSTVKVPYAYSSVGNTQAIKTGDLVKFSIPVSINLTHYQILSLISQQFIQQINTVNNIQSFPG